MAIATEPFQASEDRIAQLTGIAYQAILERGFRGSFLELELSLWNAVRAAVHASPPARALAGRSAEFESA
jgi:hypothetical protein